MCNSQEVCIVRINSQILRKMDLPGALEFHRLESQGNLECFPHDYLDCIKSWGRRTTGYHIILCSAHIAEFLPNPGERPFVVLALFNGVTPLGFIWVVRENDIVIPYTYPKRYRDLLEARGTTPLWQTAAMLVGAAYQEHWRRWIPTAYFFPDTYWTRADLESSQL